METLGHLAADPSFLSFARFAATSFFAIVFLQSSLSKIADVDGNKAYLSDVFKDAPTLSGMIEPLFWALTLIELAAGVLCGLGIVTFSFVSGGFIARWGITFATFALLALMFGARMAKDYATAGTISGYFAVAMLGLLAFALGR
jgi:hypothetical protein